MRKYKLLMWVLVWHSFACLGQNRSSKFISIKAELSQNTVASIVQDHNGFLWIGTRNGLNRYDGINMTSYEYDGSDTTSLSNDYIRLVFEDSDNQLWVGTMGGGICLYNEDLDSFERFHVPGMPAYLKKASVKSFLEDEFNNIWFGTEKYGLHYYNRTTGEIKSYQKNLDDPFSISANHITGIVKDNIGNLWISTWGGGMNLFDHNSQRFIVYKHDKDKPESIASNIIRKLYKTKEGDIWLGTHGGLDKLEYHESGRFVFHHQKLDTELGKSGTRVILSILEDDSNQLWIGTENGGLNVISLETGNSILYTFDPRREYSLQNNSIWSLYQDNTGIIWVGTFNKGIFKIDRNASKFEHFQHNPHFSNSLSNNAVSCFVEDKLGNVWIGTDGGGLNYWNVKKNTFKSFTTKDKSNPISKDAILSLLLDSNENLWIGTWDGGINLKRKGSDKFERFTLDHPLNSSQGFENVFAIHEDKKGRIWFSAFRDGLFAYDPSDRSFIGFNHDSDNPHSISSDYVRAIMEDKNGTLWIGTEGGGLNQMFETNGQYSFKRYMTDENNDKGISSNTVISLMQDQEGIIWVGTFSGLDRLDSKKEEFTKIGKKQGLPNEVIYGIEQDEKKNLWLSSNRGLSKYDPISGDVQNYRKADGLQGMEFFKNSSYTLSSGEMLFGGVDGFNRFRPDQIKKNTYEPKVFFSDFRLYNQSVKVGEDSPLKKNIRKTEKINLNYDENDFSFEFAVLSFSQTSKNEYAFQLVNHDEGWQKVGNRREAYYTNVPPGYYVFKVKGTNNDGIWSSHESAVEIVISPAWYSTYWAYSLYIVIITALLVWGIQTIVNRERLQTQLHVEHMELSKMQELDEMKSSFFANISHEFRSPLTLILGPLKAMYDNVEFSSIKEQVSMMIRNAESLLNLINQLLELSKLESGKMRLEAVEQDVCKFLKPVIHSFSSFAARKNISYKVTVPKHEIALFFDREKLEKIVVNLLSNAFKYTAEFGHVEFELVEDKGQVTLIVKDDGIGIPEDEMEYIFNRYYRVRDAKNKKSKGTGIGLSLTKELVELHRGVIDLESKENEGSVFTVFLKKGTDHLNPEDFSSPGSEYQYENQELFKSDQQANAQPLAESLESLEDQEKQPLILVIEDNNDIRGYIKQILEPDYRVIEADNGMDGSELALERIPDLIISDIMMPSLDGFEVCKKVKNDTKTSHIPVILLTAKASNDSALEGFEKGADYYITKPFNPKLLALRVRNVLNIHDHIKNNILNRKTLNIEPSNVKIASRDEDFIKKAVKIVEDNMSNSEFYVDDLGRELGLSRMQLYRKLKGLIGQSANEFVRSIRLKRAAQLIRQNQLTISEITYQVGFNDLQYFRDCFKKQFGVNPSEYASDTEEKAS
ncbi:MAG: two-component regulator propeller domain-containing protein [Reichenbachiella sp.]|uniref:two-component regulator propeller domain-containing protein n=1 Tax=Reichenbachiella sp. TaxID=2184521 RepID=UPI00329805E8